MSTQTGDPEEARASGIMTDHETVVGSQHPKARPTARDRGLAEAGEGLRKAVGKSLAFGRIGRWIFRLPLRYIARAHQDALTFRSEIAVSADVPHEGPSFVSLAERTAHEEMPSAGRKGQRSGVAAFSEARGPWPRRVHQYVA